MLSMQRPALWFQDRLALGCETLSNKTNKQKPEFKERLPAVEGQGRLCFGSRESLSLPEAMQILLPLFGHQPDSDNKGLSSKDTAYLKLCSGDREAKRELNQKLDFRA